MNYVIGTIQAPENKGSDMKNESSSPTVALFALIAIKAIAGNPVSSRLKRPVKSLSILATSQLARYVRLLEEKSFSMALELVRLSKILQGKFQLKVVIHGPLSKRLLRYLSLKVIRLQDSSNLSLLIHR